MLPLDELSSTAVISGYIDPVKSAGDFLLDWERGGIALNDASLGRLVQLWKLTVERDPTVTTLWHVYVQAPSVAKTLLFSETGITEASLAFDQNMNPFVAYSAGGVAKMYWYDPLLPGMTTVALAAGTRNPRCTTDDKNPLNNAASDIVLAYISAGSLCVRYQRDRYTVETVLCAVGAEAELVSVGMNVLNRLQFRIRKVSVTGDDRVLQQADPLLADVVSDICRRAGLTADQIDVNELYGDTIVGYLVSSDQPVSESLQPLADAFAFAPAEYDRKLLFLKRGRAPSFAFSFDDLVNTSSKNPAMQFKPDDEEKLPIRFDVHHLDPDGGFNRNSQASYRKSNLIGARGSKELELKFAMHADDAASVSLRELKKYWHEPMEFNWALPLRFSAVMPEDVGLYAHEDGSVHRIRVEERNEADGVLTMRGRLDGGQAVYGTRVGGNALPPPISTTPGLVGDTRIELINSSPFRDQDDELGVYIAVSGETSAWYGANVLLSTDGGENYIDAFTTETAATLGDTLTELLEEPLPFGFSPQVLDVVCNDDLESVPFDTLLRNYNRAVVGDEIIQFQTATHLGGNNWRLSGIIRGRYNTAAEYWPAGTRFILLDTAVAFVQAQTWMQGSELTFKAVSFNQSEDDAVPLAYDFDVAVSQLEWPPAPAEATRTGAAVTVRWTPRGRLGNNTAPRHSKHFTGWRVVFSDGHTADVAADANSYTRAATPAGATVKVCGVNSITGNGQFTEDLAT